MFQEKFQTEAIIGGGGVGGSGNKLVSLLHMSKELYVLCFLVEVPDIGGLGGSGKSSLSG